MKVSQRLVSLDAFRGMTIMFMIIVNTPGTWSHVWGPLRHSEWHGCTPTDLVFPFFLFIVGVAMFFSFRKFDHKLTRPAAFKILKRTALIFLIGLFLNAFPRFDFEHLRIMGVLQRIALAYGMGAFLVLLLGQRGRWMSILVVLLGYWGLMHWLGGSSPYSLEGNLARKIDLAIFGADHVYKGFGVPFDPEGLLSTLPAMINVVLGFMVGRVIYRTKEKTDIILKLIMWGAVTLILGLAWSPFFPINKPIWTSSYVLYTVGIGMILLALFVWLIDKKGWKLWAHPFIVYGMNPLFIYVLAGIFVDIMIVVKIGSGDEPTSLYAWIYQHIFAAIFGNNELGSFLFALTYGLLLWLLGWILYRKKIFIKI